MIKIFTSHAPGFAGLDLYIVDHDDVSRRNVIFHFQDKELIGTVLKEYETFHAPTVHLSPEYADELIKAFAELAAERGLKTSDDKVREGKLEATEKHLEGMRKLVFEGK